jgi:hypothetical protein
MNFEQWLYTLPLRLRLRFRRKQVDQELNDELRDHLEQQIKDNVARGMSPEDARYRATRALGGITQIEQQCREARGGNATDDFIQDVRYGFRQLRRSPGFSTLAILCLTLGIGANAAVFSWVEGILFRPYPAVTHQERLVALAGTALGETRPTEVSWPDFLMCAEAALCVINCSRARLQAARSASETMPKARAAASFQPIISMRSGFIPFLAGASKRTKR